MQSKTQFCDPIFCAILRAMVLALLVLFPAIPVWSQVCFSDQPQNGFRTIYDFRGQQDGGEPLGLTVDKAGNVYGSTYYGGGGYGSNGLTYKLAPRNGSWIFDPLYSFTGGNDGFFASEVVAGPNGILYGTAYGGIQNCNGYYCDLVFSLRPSPMACRTSLCSWTENVLYLPSDLSGTLSGGVSAFDQAGNLYGISSEGGDLNCRPPWGCGTVFELTPSAGAWKESTLYTFTGSSDGSGPVALLLGNDGNLYGTTESGGDVNCNPPWGCGTVFQLVPTESGWRENVLYSFRDSESDGGFPVNLVQDSSGNLYGVSTYTGRPSEEDAIVFMLSPSNGHWVFTLLTFQGFGYEYYETFTNLAIDGAGNLYGTNSAQYLPCRGYGCNKRASLPSCFTYIFKMVRGNDGLQFTTPVCFDGGTSFRAGPAAVDAQGNFYGNTPYCGKYNQGTVWQLSP